MTKINKVGYVVIVFVFSVVFNTIFDGFIVPLILTTMSGIGILLLKEEETK